MIALSMHHARLGMMALALLMGLPACTIAIGAPPEHVSEPRPRRERPRDQIVIRGNPPPAAEDSHEALIEPGELAPGASLLIPVHGVRPDQLRDSYHDARSGGRVHNAIDIMAPAGTPVLAAADGTIHRLRTGGLGGITIYQIGTDGRTMYYYAHLQRYAAGIRDGTPVRRGQVIAYVGDTGNAAPGNYHLHFSVGRLPDPQRYWDSENVNPYPLLAGEYARASASSRDRR
ncbi:MAG TPA: M23 family metallopeptidase [Longimicrobium sp.]|nr:M23 family metallopeptidase [Longimicrobium sp.]